MHSWFRAYNDSLTDPKLCALNDTDFRFLYQLWCLASKHDGDCGTVDQIAKTLGRRRDYVEAAIGRFSQSSQDHHPLVTVSFGHISPWNWATRQYQSDASTLRVRAWRKRFKAVAGNVAKRGNETVQTRQVYTTSLPSSRETPQPTLLKTDLALPPEDHSPQPPPRQNGHASPTLAALVKAKGWAP